MHVAVGIIRKQSGEILIAQRPLDKYKGGLWEFPGGKVEKDENVFQALQRELKEEIGIKVVTAEPWLQFEYDYKDRIVLLDTWQVIEFLGEPRGIEGQQVRWVLPQELSQFEFPAGNFFILEKLVG